MIAALKLWWTNQKQAANRDRSIRLTVDIPYSVCNEIALRGLTVGVVELKLRNALGHHVVADLENVVVRCVSNPNWRS